MLNIVFGYASMDEPMYSTYCTYSEDPYMNRQLVSLEM
jgi:hypothetical protein